MSPSESIPKPDFSPFFLSTPQEYWNAPTMKKWFLDTFPASPDRVPWRRDIFAQQLQLIVDKRAPYRSFSAQWRTKAQAIRRALGQYTRNTRRATTRRTVNNNSITNNVGDINSTAGPVVVGSAEGVAAFVDQTTRGENPPGVTETAMKTATEEIGEVVISHGDAEHSGNESGDSGSGQVFFRELFESKEPDLELPIAKSFRTVLKNIVNTSSPQTSFLQQNVFFYQPLRSHFHADDLKVLKPLVPSLSPLCDDFINFLEAVKNHYANESSDSPATPAKAKEGREKAKLAVMWFYVHHTYDYFVQNMSWLTLTLPHTGEVWGDMNIWAHLIDATFRGRTDIFLNRREIEPLCAGAENKCDGVIRSFNMPLITSLSFRQAHRHVDLGFVEVKPERLPYPVESDGDNQKLIRLMKRTLAMIKQMVRDDADAMRRIALIGILCVGKEILIYRASNPHSDFTFVACDRFTLSMEELPDIMTVCWRAMSTCAQTYHVIVETVEKQWAMSP